MGNTPHQGKTNSIWINIINVEAIIPENTPKIKYKVPISLWFVEKIQR